MKSKSPIVFFIDDLAPGGAQKQLILLANQLSSILPNTIYIMCYGLNLRLQEDLDISKIKLVFLRRKYKASILIFATWELWRIKPFIVISFLRSPNIIVEIVRFFILRKFKLIISERSAQNYLLKGPLLLLQRLLHRSQPDYIVFNSSHNMDLFATYYGLDNRLTVIENFVEVKIVEIPERRKVFNIGVFANYTRNKNVQGLIAALLLLDPETLERIHIDWYGEERDESYCLAKKDVETHNLSSVLRLNGFCPNPIEKYEDLHCIASFSFFEGMSNSLLEAMAYKRVVIASRIPSSVELLKSEDFLFDPENPIEIADVLFRVSELSDNEVEKIALYNFDRISDMHNSHDILNKWLALIK